MKTAAKKNYLQLTYNENKVPRTNYPYKLSKYLCENFFNNSGSILDVGCGRGEYLEEFQNLGLQVTGVDISPSINDLKSKFNIDTCDFEHQKFSFPNDNFDFIFSKSVIEHLHKPEFLLDECYRVLKIGGRAIIMCPSWIHTYWGPFYIDHTHVTPFTIPSLEQALLLSGFKEVKVMHFIQLPLVWKWEFLKYFCDLLAMLPIPFRPLYKVNTPEWLNKIVRFSNEKMLLAFAIK